MHSAKDWFDSSAAHFSFFSTVSAVRQGIDRSALCRVYAAGGITIDACPLDDTPALSLTVPKHHRRIDPRCTVRCIHPASAPTAARTAADEASVTKSRGSTP